MVADDEDDAPKRPRIVAKHSYHCMDGYVGSKIERVAEDSGGDGGEGDRLQAVRLGELQRRAVGAGKLVGFACSAAMPNRANCMDDVTGFEPEAWSNARFASGTRSDRAAGALQIGMTRCLKDGAAHTASGHKLLVSGINDGVNVHFRQIAEYDFDACGPDLAHCRAV